MKALTLLFALGLSFLSFQQPPDPGTDLNRFAITVNEKTGFINTAGDIVIVPRFESAQEFSEGLCAVRIGGKYGFIDTGGVITIPPVYDYATEFREGLALVFLDGKPLFITHENAKAVSVAYKYMTYFDEGRSYVRTYSGKVGIIDRTGKLVVDTVYKNIGPFTDGLAIVSGWDHQPDDTEDKKKNLEVSVINEAGEKLVPYGKFEEINYYSDGYFVVTFPEKKGGNVSLDGYMNRQGAVVYTLPKNQVSWIEGGVHNGIARVKLPSGRKKKRSDDQSDKYYDAYITPAGIPVYMNKEVRDGKDFCEGFAFFENDDHKLSLINRLGEVIARDRFLDVVGGSFDRGRAVVRTDEGWGVIDTTARFIVPPMFEKIDEHGGVDDLIFFRDTVRHTIPYQDSVYVKPGDPRYGVADLNGAIIIPPTFQYFDRRGFVKGLLKAWVDDRVTYFNRTGKMVWQETLWEPEDPQPLNIDYMNRGYFYANADPTGHGGSGRRAGPEKITMQNSFPDAAFSVIVRPDLEVVLGGKVSGMVVYVANATGDTIRFNAQDSRLYMNIQALDAAGAWCDIEYLPRSWCGNSYHHVDLPADHYWTFSAPVYEGGFPTKLRVKLTYVDPSDQPTPEQKKNKYMDWAYGDKRQLDIYSNEFEGSINPAQFWRRPEYYPSGIMDPYNE